VLSEIVTDVESAKTLAQTGNGHLAMANSEDVGTVIVGKLESIHTVRVD
jgi:hypothetical protein